MKNDLHKILLNSNKYLNKAFNYQKKTSQIAVDPEFRRNGVTKKLIAYLKEICVAKGIKEMYVGTEKDNNPAIKLYKSTGGYMEEIAWFVYNII